MDSSNIIDEDRFQASAVDKFFLQYAKGVYQKEDSQLAAQKIEPTKGGFLLLFLRSVAEKVKPVGLMKLSVGNLSKHYSLVA